MSKNGDETKFVSMASNVVPLRGRGAIPILREALERAERGELIGLVIAYECAPDHSTAYDWCYSPSMSFITPLIGGLERAKWALCQEHEQRPEIVPEEKSE